MCPHEEKLTAWLLGDLPSLEQDEMTRHVERCAECREVRDELASVLAPLRHGLEKDRTIMPIMPGMVQHKRCGAVQPRVSLQRWLSRAALFALSCGALFALVSALQTKRNERDGGVVTHMTFQREPESPPELSPVCENIAEESAPLADFNPEFPADASRNKERMTVPPLPSAAPGMPRLPVLMKGRGAVVADQKDDVPQHASPAAEMASQRESADKKSGRYEPRKREAGRIPDPPASLVIKPIMLGSVAPDSLASTNSVPSATNAPAVPQPR